MPAITQRQKILLIVLAVLVAVRVLLPFGMKVAINVLLDKHIGSMQGRIEEVDLALWRGHFRAHGYSMKEKDSPGPTLMGAREVDLDLAWRTLARGQLWVDLTVRGYVLNILVDDGLPPGPPGKPGPTVLQVFKQFRKLHIESVKVEDAQVHFHGISKGKEFHNRIERINVEALHIGNQRRLQLGEYAPLDLEELIEGKAPLKIRASLDWWAAPIDFDIDLHIKSLDLKALNPILRAYAPVIVDKGGLDLFMQAVHFKADTRGCMRPFLRDVDVEKNPGDRTGPSGLLSLANAFLENPKTKSIATELCFRGPLLKLRWNDDHAVETALQNSFKTPIKEGFDGRFKLPGHFVRK